MAWSFAARRDNPGRQNDWRFAAAFSAQMKAFDG
jgi:hypothetical protein